MGVEIFEVATSLGKPANHEGERTTLSLATTIAPQVGEQGDDDDCPQNGEQADDDDCAASWRAS